MANFRWNVHPYDTLSELRQYYTQVAVATTRRKAVERKGEITAWMRANAPWQDDTGVARKNLRAEVINPLTHEEEHRFGSIMREAEKADRKVLKQVNRERAKAGEIPLNRLTGSTTNVAKVTKKMRAYIGPIVRMRFRHGFPEQVPHGVWLEVANQGRYSIILPTFQYWTRILGNDIRQIANLIQYQKSDILTKITPDVNTLEFQESQFLEEMREFERAYDKPYEPWTPERQAESVFRTRQRKRQRIARETGQPIKRERRTTRRPKY